MIKKVIKLAVFLSIANAVYQVAPVTLHYFGSRTPSRSSRCSRAKSTDAQLVDRVMALAEEHSIPLEREYVQVSRQRNLAHDQRRLRGDVAVFPRHPVHVGNSTSPPGP